MTAVMIDLEGPELTAEERELLAHPAVGGVIYFTRNYEDPAQIQELVRQTRAAARNPLILAVDHEGGRVQRFRQGFSEIPAMARIGRQAQNASEAQQWAQELGWLMASEVLAVDIDISFAPVLDVNGISEVIGDRAFAEQPDGIIPIARAFIKGMHQAGMKATGKHFPGHGSVAADSHIAIPVDNRLWDEIVATDLPPFIELASCLDAIMPAHVIYPDVCKHPAGFSEHWLQDVLRAQLEFHGVIFSDDLAMAGATVAGTMAERAKAALRAGCDMVLACNDRAGAITVIETVAPIVSKDPRRYARSYELLAKSASMNLNTLHNHPRWHSAQQVLQKVAAG
ncbi:beta-N-acetylhexosaminidase [Pseudidiomarina sp.]|uniref:beta-N-acetylhexosaminidase n=1 Tax=Pseudidiomarina sp. TaxID=2081707 RepID=UPI00299F14F0|nr:beta-N-acetylhexosaminidase [Pseudidiomarina sp.]MDX1706248.1 beta-N-acetylhexosaminidase [Pseudidiomarina sp.]